MLLFTSNWISQLLVHDTPSQISVPYSSGHVLLLVHLWVRWADILGLARLTHVSVVSWWLKRHVWPWSCSGLTLMFGCWLVISQTGTTLTEVTRLSSTWSVILWGLAQASSHGGGRTPRGSWDSQGLMWSRLRTAPITSVTFNWVKPFSQSVKCTRWRTYIQGRHWGFQCSQPAAHKIQIPWTFHWLITSHDGKPGFRQNRELSMMSPATQIRFILPLSHSQSAGLFSGQLILRSQAAISKNWRQLPHCSHLIGSSTWESWHIPALRWLGLASVPPSLH